MGNGFSGKGNGKVAEPHDDSREPARGGEARRFQERSAAMDWGYDNPEARALVREILSSAAPCFSSAVVKDLPDAGHIALRGSVAGVPIQFQIWLSFGSFWTIEMLAPGQVTMFSLSRDHDKVPKAADASDPFSTDEERRVFVGRGIFFEGQDAMVTANLQAWSAVASDLQQRILQQMEHLGVRFLTISQKSLVLSVTPGLADLPDPVNYMVQCAELLNLARAAELKSDWPMSMAAAAAASVAIPSRITCTYCASLYLLSAAATHCPNCGAPPRESA